MPRDEKRDPAYLWDRLDAAKTITVFAAIVTKHIPELVQFLELLIPTNPILNDER